MQLYTKGMIEFGFRGMEDDVVDPNKYRIDWDSPTFADDDNNTITVNELINILTGKTISIFTISS